MAAALPQTHAFMIFFLQEKIFFLYKKKTFFLVLWWKRYAFIVSMFPVSFLPYFCTAESWILPTFLGEVDKLCWLLLCWLVLPQHYTVMGTFSFVSIKRRNERIFIYQRWDAFTTRLRVKSAFCSHRTRSRVGDRFISIAGLFTVQFHFHSLQCL